MNRKIKKDQEILLKSCQHFQQDYMCILHSKLCNCDWINHEE